MPVVARSDDQPTAPCESIPDCPVCGIHPMTVDFQEVGVTVCVCSDCGTRLTVTDEGLRRLDARLRVSVVRKSDRRQAFSFF